MLHLVGSLYNKCIRDAQPQAAALGVEVTRGKLDSSLKNVASRMSPPLAATKYRNVDSVVSFCIKQCFSSFLRPRSGKFFFYKTRARSQQIYS